MSFVSRRTRLCVCERACVYACGCVSVRVRGCVCLSCVCVRGGVGVCVREWLRLSVSVFVCVRARAFVRL